MINPEELNQEVKMFKNGNSYAFRISKKDREFMNLNDSTEFEKIVSPDGKKITFQKIEGSRPSVLKSAHKAIEDNAELMKRLENL